MYSIVFFGPRFFRIDFLYSLYCVVSVLHVERYGVSTWILGRYFSRNVICTMSVYGNNSFVDSIAGIMYAVGRKKRSSDVLR